MENNLSVVEENFKELLKPGMKGTIEKVNHLSELSEDYGSYDVVGIDEGQFFSDLQGFVLKLVECYNIKVIVAGLNVDSNRDAFGDLISLVKLNGISL